MKRSRKSLFSWTGALALGAVSLLGCGGSMATTGDEAYAADSTDTADQVSALVSVSSDGVDTQMASLSNETAAQLAASSATAKLTTGCLTTNLAGNVVTYTMNACSGPYGLVKLTGTLLATYTVQGVGPATTLTVALSGTNLKLNDATLNVSSQAVVSGPAQNRVAVVTSNTSAVSARGNNIVHSGNYTAGWDGMCVTLTGNYMTRIGLAAYSTQIEAYKRCQNTCPKTGVITFTGRNVITLTFNGTAQAALTLNGKAGTLPLLCQP